MPGLSDYVIMVRGRAKAFLAGPPLVKAATGEIATDEELGGAVMHTGVSGLGEYLAEKIRRERPSHERPFLLLVVGYLFGLLSLRVADSADGLSIVVANTGPGLPV